MHATQNIHLHNIVGTCTKEGLKENTTQIAKYKKHSDLIPRKFVEMSNFFEFLFILKFVTKKMHAMHSVHVGWKTYLHRGKSACICASVHV